MKGNLRRWIEEKLAADEVVEGVAIGDYGSPSVDECPVSIPDEKKYVVLKWEEAKHLIDYDFDNDWGDLNCHAVYAWTNRRVFFVVTYDGLVWLGWVPRNPEPCRPEMFGG